MASPSVQFTPANKLTSRHPSGAVAGWFYKEVEVNKTSISPWN